MSSSPSRRSRGRLLSAIVLGGAIVLAAALVAFSLVTARSAMARGVTDLRAAQSALRVQRLKQSPTGSLTRAQVAVRRANAQFTTAWDRLAPLRPLLDRLGWLPVVGPDLAAAPGLALTARDATVGARWLLQGVMPASRALVSSQSRGQVRSTLLTDLVAQSRPEFRRACRALDGAARQRAALPHTLSARASGAVRTLDRQLPRLRVLCQGLLLVPRLLGRGRPMTYLVAYEDANELRATGGFIGSAGLVTVRNGVAQQQAQSVLTPRENISLPAPDPVTYYNQESWLFRDANWAADFPTSAALERFFFKLDFRRNIPNVVNITPQGAQALLAATGPIYLPEYRRTVTGGNVAQLADYYTHWSSWHGPQAAQVVKVNPVQQDLRKKQFVQIVARHVFSRLQRLSVDRLVALGNHLATAFRQRAILVNFRDPRLQALARAAGADGSIDPTRADYLYVVDTNLSYNKINPWVHVRWRYRVRIRPDRWMDDRLTIRITNGPLPKRVIGRGIGPGASTLGRPSDYADFIRVFVPAGAQLIDQLGWTQPWSPGSVYGKTMLSGYVIVPRGQTQTITLHYVVPPNGFVGSAAAYRLTVQHQPGSRPDGFSVAVRDAATGRARSWTVPSPRTDWSTRMPIANRPVRPIPLTLSNVHPVVGPNRTIEPHAFLGKPKNQYALNG